MVRGKLTLTLITLTWLVFGSIEIPKRAFRMYQKGDLTKTIEALQKTLTQKESIISELTDKRDQALMNAAKLEIKLESALKYQGKADTLQSALEKERNARHQAELTNAKLQALLDRGQP